VPDLGRISFAFGSTALVLLSGACGSDETAPVVEDHVPASYQVFINDNLVTPPFTFTSGQTVRVRLKFFNAAAQDLDEVEDSHFGGLTFDPPALATATRVADHHYQFDVTGEAVGSGTVTVGFGHDDMADETTFPPADVNVTGIPGP
jgi:hypothetical protein